MTLFVPDYAILAVALIMATIGAFGGFSGSLAFLLASVSGGLAAKYGWALSGAFLNESWSRAVVVLIATLVIFGLVRLLVRKFVSGVLSQPADAIFGFVVGAFTGAAIAMVVVTAVGPDYFAFIQERSALLALLPWRFSL